LGRIDENLLVPQHHFDVEVAIMLEVSISIALQAVRLAVRYPLLSIRERRLSASQLVMARARVPK
jgi:hypothetical protein